MDLLYLPASPKFVIFWNMDWWSLVQEQVGWQEEKKHCGHHITRMRQKENHPGPTARLGRFVNTCNYSGLHLEQFYENATPRLARGAPLLAFLILRPFGAAA